MDRFGFGSVYDFATGFTFLLVLLVFSLCVGVSCSLLFCRACSWWRFRPCGWVLGGGIGWYCWCYVCYVSWVFAWRSFFSEVYCVDAVDVCAWSGVFGRVFGLLGCLFVFYRFFSGILLRPGILSKAGSSDIMVGSTARADAAIRLSKKVSPYFSSSSACLMIRSVFIVLASLTP